MPVGVAALVLDNDHYERTDAVALLTLSDDNASVSDNMIETITVRVASSSDRSGIQITCRETSADSRTFQGNFGFNVSRSSQSAVQILVANGDSVFVEYEDNNPLMTRTTGAIWYEGPDRTAPKFEVTVLPNPVLPDFLDIYFSASELLAQRPTVSINDIATTVDVVPGVPRLYVVDHQLTETQNYELRGQGVDLAGNEVNFSSQFSAAKISASEGGLINSWDLALQVEVPAVAVDKGEYFLILPENLTGVAKGTNGSQKLSQASNIPVDLENDSLFVSSYYKLLNHSNKLSDYVQVRFDLTKVFKSKPQEVGRVIVEIFFDNEWHELNTFLQPEDQVALASTNRLGLLRVKAYPRESPLFVPEDYVVHQNYPNPFNAGTNIRFELPNAAIVKIVIYDLLGRRVRMLLNSFKPLGIHNLTWDARDDSGQNLSSGVYFVHVKLGKRRESTLKAIILR